MTSYKFSIPWETIVKIAPVLALVVSTFVGLTSFLNSRSPQIIVRNELAFPIRIFAGDDYQGIVSPYKKRTVKFYSERVFPVKIKWEGIRQKDSNGKPVGDLVTGAIEFVDNHQEITITHTTGKNDYFMPILTNETNLSCEIFINDGLPSEQHAGFLLPEKQRVNVGYYKWYGNSNVTLYCENEPHWWGDRNGEKGPKLTVESPSGETNLTLTP